MKYAWIARHKTRWPITLACDVLGVSASGYFESLRRSQQERPSQPGAGRIGNEALLAHIRAIHAEVKQEYGWPRMWKELVARGFRVGKERVRRLMKQHGIRARGKRKFVATTDSRHDLPIAPNLLQRNFTSDAPNRVWSGDITYAGLFFKNGPGIALPITHGILIALDRTLLGLLHAEAQRSQNSPDMGLAETHAVQAFDDGANTLEGPQLGSKAMFGRAPQNGCSYGSQLCLIELGGSAPSRYRAQSIDAAFIEQRLPRVHGLARDAHCKRHLRAALAFLQHPPGTQPLSCRFAQSLLHHANILQQ